MISKLTLTLLTASMVFAQTQRTPPSPATQAQMRVNMLSSQLNLTDAQKTSALTIYTNAITAAETIRSSAQTSRQSLADAVKKNDTATIDQLSASLGTLEGQMTAIDSKADAAFYAILTSAQQALFDSMPRGGRGGPGFPGGRGMGFRQRP